MKIEIEINTEKKGEKFWIRAAITIIFVLVAIYLFINSFAGKYFSYDFLNFIMPIWCILSPIIVLIIWGSYKPYKPSSSKK